MKRLVTLILILVLMMAFATTAAFAQEQACGDLGDEDCARLYAAQEAMADITSGNSMYAVDLQVTNVPQTPFRDLEFSFDLDQTFEYGDEAAALAQEMQQMSASELAALYGSPSEMASMMSQLLNGLSAEIDMSASFSEELANLLTTDPTMAWPQQFDLSLVIADGVAYVDLSTLEGLLAEAGAMPMSGWIGAEFVPLVEQSLMQSAADPNAAAIAAATSSSFSGDPGPLFTQLAAADPTGTILNFLNIEAVDDQSFRTSVDWQAFVESPYFELVVLSLLQQSGAGAMPSQAEIDQIVQIGRMFGPALLDGITLELVETVDPETNVLSDTDFTFYWDLSDLAALSAMGGDMGVDLGDVDSVISLTIATSNSDINEDVEINVPSDAFVLPANSLMQMMAPAQ